MNEIIENLNVTLLRGATDFQKTSMPVDDVLICEWKMNLHILKCEILNQ